jgi:hypothetical protein
MLHAFAIIRAVEKQLGPLWSIEVPRDPDSNSPMNMIFATLIRPTKLSRALDLEVPSPAGIEGLEARRLRFGGPGLEDIKAVLQGESSKAPEGQQRQMIQVRVEERRQREQRKERYMKRRQARTEQETREDEQILAALKQLAGGPYGGFEGLAEKVEEQLSRSAERLRIDGAASAEGAEAVEEPTEAGEETGASATGTSEVGRSAEDARPQEAPMETESVASPSESTTTTNEDASHPTANEAQPKPTVQAESEARL